MIALQNELAGFRAEELAASAEIAGERRVVIRAIDADANTLKGLAAALAARPGVIVVLVSTATPALVVAARSSDVDRSAQQVIAGLVAAFGGRGGGKPELAQGGGLNGSTEAILAEARKLIT
jgi:alanyl-tRNA synthetase